MVDNTCTAMCRLMVDVQKIAEVTELRVLAPNVFLINASTHQPLHISPKISLFNSSERASILKVIVSRTVED